MPTLDDTVARAVPPPTQDRWDREVDRAEWIELPDQKIPLEALIWTVFGAFGLCVLAAII